MFIVPKIPNGFKHDYGRFETGEIYDVPDELGQYFVNADWADGYESFAAALDETVEPQATTTGSPIPPPQFFVDEGMMVHEVEPAAFKTSRAPDGSLEIHDSSSGQEGGL